MSFIEPVYIEAVTGYNNIGLVFEAAGAYLSRESWQHCLTHSTVLVSVERLSLSYHADACIVE